MGLGKVLGRNKRWSGDVGLLSHRFSILGPLASRLHRPRFEPANQRQEEEAWHGMAGRTRRTQWQWHGTVGVVQHSLTDWQLPAMKKNLRRFPQLTDDGAIDYVGTLPGRRRSVLSSPIEVADGFSLARPMSVYLPETKDGSRMRPRGHPDCLSGTTSLGT